MTNREIKNLYTVISLIPGYILDLSRTELDDMVEEYTPYELSETGSNGIRLKALLQKHPQEEMEPLISALKKRNKVAYIND